MTCRLCEERGIPDHFASNPNCAFDETGTFTGDNWQCATMNALRDLVEDGYGERIYGDDESIAIIRVPYHIGLGFIVMTWYKDRGQTGNAIVMSTDHPERKLDLRLAEEVIELMGDKK